MHIAVVGAGPAGLTAAHRLQQAGHRVDVLEARSVVGGRTHAEHFGPGHHCDTGAGWLATFYTQTLKLFHEVGYDDLYLIPRTVRGAADLLIDGKIAPWPFRGPSVAASALLSPADKERYDAYIDHIMQIQPNHLQPDLLYDGRSADEEFAPLGERVVEIILRSMFEGPWFTRLDTLSATHVRLWLRDIQDGFFFQVKHGMDAPWLHLARQLPIQTDSAVESLTVGAQQVVLTTGRGEAQYDGVVLATPAPVTARLLADQPDLAPPWLHDVRYAPEVRVYAARACADEAHFGVHILPPGDLFSVEYYSGKYGSWGACPQDWQWVLLCTYGPTTEKFLHRDQDTVMRELWAQADAITPNLFSLDEADVVHYHHWEHAVPVMGPGHYRRLAQFQQQAPIVFAGDWMSEACVEGAVRSGEAAAQVFGR
ncbi:MAG TPA: NAD(P)/FAD-dependent oxidoreductase [Caldilineaceae bacterium]|nr:NAD(P)/FAD-dependent oxidoreductase [Caldilineaceae bacterium]